MNPRLKALNADYFQLVREPLEVQGLRRDRKVFAKDGSIIYDTNHRGFRTPRLESYYPTDTHPAYYVPVPSPGPGEYKIIPAALGAHDLPDRVYPPGKKPLAQYVGLNKLNSPDIWQIDDHTWTDGHVLCVGPIPPGAIPWNRRKIPDLSPVTDVWPVDMPAETAMRHGAIYRIMGHGFQKVLVDFVWRNWNGMNWRLSSNGHMLGCFGADGQLQALIMGTMDKGGTECLPNKLPKKRG